MQKKLWESFKGIDKYNKDRFYGTDTIFNLLFNKVTFIISDSNPLNTNLANIKITVPDDDITGVTNDKVAEALDSEFISVSSLTLNSLSQNKVTVPISNVKAIKLTPDNSKFTTPVLDAKITVSIPDNLVDPLDLMGNHVQDCITFVCNITVPSAEITARIPDEVRWQNADSKMIESIVENMKIRFETILWSCSTPNPGPFWKRFLIRSEKDVVICIEQSE